jgi:hypothetical protein
MTCPMEEIVTVAESLRVAERSGGEAEPHSIVSLMVALGSIE